MKWIGARSVLRAAPAPLPAMVNVIIGGLQVVTDDRTQDSRTSSRIARGATKCENCRCAVWLSRMFGEALWWFAENDQSRSACLWLRLNPTFSGCLGLVTETITSHLRLVLIGFYSAVFIQGPETYILTIAYTIHEFHRWRSHFLARLTAYYFVLVTRPPRSTHLHARRLWRPKMKAQDRLSGQS